MNDKTMHARDYVNDTDERPAKKRHIAHVTNFHEVKDAIAELATGTWSCSICVEAYVPTVRVCRMSCGHIFCVKCTIVMAKTASAGTVTSQDCAICRAKKVFVNAPVYVCRISTLLTDVIIEQTNTRTLLDGDTFEFSPRAEFAQVADLVSLFDSIPKMLDPKVPYEDWMRTEAMKVVDNVPADFSLNASEEAVIRHIQMEQELTVASCERQIKMLTKLADISKNNINMLDNRLIRICERKEGINSTIANTIEHVIHEIE